MANGGGYGFMAGIVGVFGLLFGLVTRRVNGVADCQSKQGERLASLEAHCTDLKSGQRRIEGKVDRLLER